MRVREVERLKDRPCKRQAKQKIGQAKDRQSKRQDKQKIEQSKDREDERTKDLEKEIISGIYAKKD